MDSSEPSTSRKPLVARGFTVVELMVSIAIFGVLLALLSPALEGAIGAARNVKCQASLRTVAADFGLFADQTIHPNRGDDNKLRNRFRLSTFQEHEYSIDEFWAFGDAEEHLLNQVSEVDPMRCAAVAGSIRVAKNQACTSTGALNPPQNISYGFNSRLHRAEVDGPGGFPLPRPVLLTSEILQHSDVPLAWDVDGAAAFRMGVLPQFSAPSLDSKAIYAGDRFWFPGYRHGGVINVAFVGGHVLTTKKPLEEATWHWGYQPIN